MDFSPENELEKAMLLAASQESARPAFFHLLMEAELYVLGEADADTGSLSIETVTREGVRYQPIFTSERRVHEFVTTPMAGFTMRGRALFLSTPGANFVINPGSQINKILMPGEVAFWLEHAAAPSDVTLVPPPKQTKKLVQALSVLFTSRTRVTSARLVYVEQEGRKPYPLIGIEAEGDVRLLSKEIFAAAAEAMPKARVDMLHLDAPGLEHPLKDHLLTVAPFYVRKIPFN